MTSGEVIAETAGDEQKKAYNDWTCTNCNFSNFQDRDICKQCATPNITSALVPTVAQPPKLTKRKLDDVVQSEESNWICEECTYKNYASARECFQCKKSQESQKRKKSDDRDPGNWICGACKNDNWPHRVVCNRCKVPKNIAQERGGKLNEWVCLNCDNVNRAYRMECNKCKIPVAEGTHPNTALTRTNIDWLCMSCGNSNYPYRIACNKCKLPKREAMSAVRAPGSVDSDKGENWLCYNCDNVNLPFRTECNKCKMDKKDATNPNTAFKRSNLDWKCTVCDNVNFFYRVYCNKCQLPKSEIGEEVAPPPQQHQQPPPPNDYYSSYQQQSYEQGPQHAYYHESGVPQEPIAQHAAEMYRQQQAQQQVSSGRVPYTVQHDLVNDKTNNWTCFNCDNMNFPLRTACNKCKMAKAEALAPETRSGRMSAGDEQWRCPSCSNSNYHFRIECNKCQTERPPRYSNPAGLSEDYGYGHNDYHNSGYGQSTGYPIQTYSNNGPSVPSMGPGEPTCNWICTSCENVNWPKRSRCNKCSLEKSSQTPNWVCRFCSHVNYNFVSECGSCKAVKDT